LSPTIVYHKKADEVVLTVDSQASQILEIKEKFKQRNGRYPNDEELKDIISNQ
jgi:hypothetical protein